MTYIIAEISGNHNGSYTEALKLIEAAAKCGCDAAKFQLYRPEDMHDLANNHIYEKYAVPEDWLRGLFAIDFGIDIFASIFSPWAVRALRPYTNTFKIASPESTKLPDYQSIIDEIRRDPRAKIIFSTGRNDFPQTEKYSKIHDEILYCKPPPNGSPAVIDETDLEFIHEHDVGFSDHTLGIMSTMSAIGAGAHIIEKHFKITEDCVDAAFSVNPEEMKLLCELAHK